MEASGVQCYYKPVCTVSPFGDGLRSAKIVCSPTGTALNVTQLRVYYGSLDRLAGDLFAEWPASEEAEFLGPAQITRNGTAFEVSVPTSVNRVNFMYYATISGTDAAGIEVHSRTTRLYSRSTCNGAGLTFVHIFLFIGLLVGGCCLLGSFCELLDGIEQMCVRGGTQYGRVRTNDAANGNADNVELHHHDVDAA
jgi:hypothetical protein